MWWSKSKPEEITFPDPLNAELCAKCRHYFEKGTGKTISHSTGRRKINYTYCREHAPAYDRVGFEVVRSEEPIPFGSNPPVEKVYYSLIPERYVRVNEDGTPYAV